MRYPILIASLSILAVPALAQAADCRPAFEESDHSLTIDGVKIEPGGQAIRDFQVQLRNAGDAESCEAIIRIARVGALRDPDFPAYKLSAQGRQQVEVLPDPSSGGTIDSDIRVANAPTGPQSRAIPFQVIVPTQWGLRAGTYVEQLQLALIDQDGNIADLSTLTITIVIPSAASLRLSGAVVGDGRSGPAQVDLGNLSSTRETRSKRFGARIFSTAPYVVRFSSVNRGNLLHEGGREQVPYRLYFDGALVDLAGASEFPYLNSTPKGGDRRPMSIVVPPVVALAGHYSDRITVTVTAL